MTRKFDFIFFLIILGASIILMLAGLTKGHDWGDDFSCYIMQAKSIVNFSCYKFLEVNQFTIEQSSIHLGPIAYPWGYPVLLAPLYAIFGLNIIALKMVGVLTYSFFLGVLWYGFRKVHSPVMNICLLCLFAFNPVLLMDYSNSIISDIPFLSLSTMGIILIQWVIVERRQLISRNVDFFFLGLVFAYAFFIRSNGVFLLVTFGGSQIISYLIDQCDKQADSNNGKWKLKVEINNLFAVRGGFTRSQLTNVIPYGVFLLIVVVWSFVLPEGGAGHIAYLKKMSLDSIKSNLNFYAHELGRFFIGVQYYNLLYMLSIPLAVVGMIKKVRSAYPAILYMALTITLYVIWPDAGGYRYLFPILPFYLSFVLSGVEMILEYKVYPTFGNKWFRKIVCYMPIIFIITSFVMMSGQRAYGNLQMNRVLSDGPFTPSSKSLFDYISDHTEKDSTVIFRKPRVMGLLTKHKSVAIQTLGQIVGQISRWDYIESPQKTTTPKACSLLEI